MCGQIIQDKSLKVEANTLLYNIIWSTEKFWSPYLRKDIISLEVVQRRFTRMIPSMEGLSHEERLNRLGLYSLEFRRMRGELIETYRILKGLDRGNVSPHGRVLDQRA